MVFSKTDTTLSSFIKEAPPEDLSAITSQIFSRVSQLQPQQQQLFFKELQRDPQAKQIFEKAQTF